MRKLPLFLSLALSACTIVGGYTPSDSDAAVDTDAPAETEDTDSVPADPEEVVDTETDADDTVETEPVDSADTTEDTEETSEPVGTDHDRDGFYAGLGRGEDCDDDNDDVNPDAVEIVGNGIDEDCDGRDCPGGEDLCFLDKDSNGHPDAIAWADDAWRNQTFTGDDATVLENGAGTGCRLTGRVLTSNGLSYILDFRGVGDCTTGITLKTDGGNEWWQNAGFCQSRYGPTDPDSWCYQTDPVRHPGDLMVGLRWDGDQLSPFDP